MGFCALMVGCAPAQPPREPAPPTLVAGPPPSDPAPVEGDAALVDALRPGFDRYRTVGLVAAEVSADGTKTVAMGRRVRGSDDLLQTQDSVHWASATKWVTAQVLVELALQGRVDLDASIQETWREMPADHPLGAATLWQLLAHRSGLPAEEAFDAEQWTQEAAREPADPVAARRQAAMMILEQRAVAEPGTQTAYTDAGYTLAVVAVEAQLGQPWEALLVSTLTPLVPREQAATLGFGWPTGPGQPAGVRGHAMNAEMTEPLPAVEFDARLVIPKRRRPGEDFRASVPTVATLLRRRLDALAGRAGADAKRLYTRMHTNFGGEGEAMMGAGLELRPAAEGKPEVHYMLGSLGSFFTVIAVVPERDKAYVLATNIGRGGPVIVGLDAMVSRSAPEG